MRGALIGTALGAFTAACRLDAQEVWLVPDGFKLASTASILATARAGSRFPSDKSPMRPRMLAEARLVGAGGQTRITDVWSDGVALRLRARPKQAGQYVVAIALRPRTGRTTQAAFVRRLRAEGADGEAARLESEKAFAPTDTVTYRSAGYATAIVDIGSGPRAFDRAVGLAIDIIPLADPARAIAGDTLVFRLLIDGNPVSRLHVRIRMAPDPIARPSSGQESTTPDYQVITDHNGVLSVPVTRPGVWSLSAARVVLLASPGPSGPEPGYWDVTWVTHVFKVYRRGGG